MLDILDTLYATILDRRDNPAEKSYTCYLFEQGLDKILKKIGEECTETVIAAKNGDNAATAGEIADLLYHLLVMMAQQNIIPDDITAVLAERHKISGNLKAFRKTDKST
ncbi:MAG: phosphoribosyl-ATP diphosphatase [Oscillospiraceae bacterium]|nr:phosphoribosyl-ATP diphosphatase [Oscillospiraceae bacterium]